MRILSERVYIQAPAKAVWAVMADFGGVADWAPYMKQSHLIGTIERGVGTRRGMRHAWGFRFEEAVTEWNEGAGYCFDVFRAPYPMKNVRETWVTFSDEGLSTVRTRVSYEMHLGLLGRLIDWLLVRFIVQREMRAGLRGLKHYLENGDGRSIVLQHAD
jgi:ligand-binding SRPBCC domain-containing protein